MKAYKIRSLFFFSCFVIAAIVYYNVEQQENFSDKFSPSEMVDLEAYDSDEANESEEENIEDNFPN